MNKNDYIALRKTLSRDGVLGRNNIVGGVSALFELCFFTGTLAALSYTTSWSMAFWLLQVLLAISIYRCFVLLHDCGHYSLFTNKKVNSIVGTLLSIVCVTPLLPWREIHKNHHRWVGIYDRDPTSARLEKFKSHQQHSPWYVALLRFTWKTRLPLPSILFTLETLWLYPFRIFKDGDAKHAAQAILSLLPIIFSHAFLIKICGLDVYASYFLPALLISFYWYEMINLTHHAGLYVLSSKTQEKPVPFYEQERFCRSATIPSWVSLLACYHFTLHTEHHLFPSAPWHQLPTIKRHLSNYSLEKYNSVEFPSFQNSLRKVDPVDVLLNQLPDSILELQKPLH
ncbi:MAG: hypothetical protein COA99_09010 [Moraxellaceae bacterium]|nr:MAG: hypothetical protein COA99_09010 [Moraxellaceae bacterium]